MSARVFFRWRSQYTAYGVGIVGAIFFSIWVVRMIFVAVFVFRQQLRSGEIQRVLGEVSKTLTDLALGRGEVVVEGSVEVALMDGTPRNAFAPESHTKSFQGLDVLMLVFKPGASEEVCSEIKEVLERQFRERWVARARVFGVPSERWFISPASVK